MLSLVQSTIPVYDLQYLSHDQQYWLCILKNSNCISVMINNTDFVYLKIQTKMVVLLKYLAGILGSINPKIFL